MDTKKHLILVKNEDKTEAINYCKYENGKWQVQLATVTNVKDEEDKSFLSRQYEKITFISPSSVLAKYLYPGEFEKCQLHSLPIFPFGFNLSQKKATENALTEQLSVMEGPPGTGKTQTILNIIANAIMNHKTVAVVSANNSATANVVEKLQQYGVDFIAAYLGNKKNREKFFSGQTNAYPDMTPWVMDKDDYKELEATLKIQGKELERMLEVQKQAALLKQELSALSLEKEYFDTYYQETYQAIPAYRSFRRHNAEAVMSLWMLASIIKLFKHVPRTLLMEHYRCHPKIIGFCNQKFFNKLDKMPVLVAEVDGYAFHANNPKQLERDKMKDDILWRYGIPMLRLKTNESREEERLYNKLIQVLNMT